MYPSLQEKEKRIAKIVEFLKNKRGEPFSISGLNSEIGGLGDNRTIARDLDHIVQSKLYNIRHKIIGKSYVYWHSNNLPLVEGIDVLNKLALNRQYPIHTIIAKMNEISGPESEFLEPERDFTSGTHRTSRLISETKKELLWWSGDFSIFDMIKKHFIKFLENGGRIKILMNVTKYSLKNAKGVIELSQMYPSKVEIRHWESQWRGAIGDRKIVWLVEKMPRRPEAMLNLSNGKMGSSDDFMYRGWYLNSNIQNQAPWVNWCCYQWDEHWKESEISPSVSELIYQLVRYE